LSEEGRIMASTPKSLGYIKPKAEQRTTPAGGWGLSSTAKRKERIKAFAKMVEKYPELDWEAESPEVAAHAMADIERVMSKRSNLTRLGDKGSGQSAAERKLWNLTYKEWRDDLDKKRLKKQTKREQEGIGAAPYGPKPKDSAIPFQKRLASGNVKKKVKKAHGGYVKKYAKGGGVRKVRT
jgi:hypothetical protein